MASVTTTATATGSDASGKNVIANVNGVTRAVRTATGVDTATAMVSGTATAAMIDACCAALLSINIAPRGIVLRVSTLQERQFATH